MALNHNWDKGWAQLNQHSFAELSISSSSDAQVTLYQLNHQVREWVLGRRIFYCPQVIQCAAKFGTKALAPCFIPDVISDTLDLPFLPSYRASLCSPGTSNLNQPCFSHTHSHPSSLSVGVTARGTFTFTQTCRLDAPPWKHVLSHTIPSKPLQFHLPHYYKDCELLAKYVLLIFGPLTQCLTYNR